MHVLIVSLAGLGVTLCASSQDVEEIPCDTTAGWTILDLSGNAPKDASLSVGSDGVAVRYDRAQLALIARAALLTELRELRLKVRSKVDIPLLLCVEDRDRARFQFVVDLPAGAEKTIVARPEDFKLTDDSPVKKDSLDPKRLAMTFVLADLGAAFGASGANTLTIEEVRVERGELKTEKGDLTLEKDLEIRESVFREGSITVPRGRRLRVTAPRFAIQGSITVEGTLEFVGGLVEIRGRFAYEFGLAGVGASKILFQDSTCVSRNAAGAYVGDGCTFQAEQTTFQPGLTFDARTKGKIVLGRVTTPGEFVIGPDADVTMSDSTGLVVWLVPGAATRGRLAFPDGAKVERWEAGWGFHVRMERCAAVVWGIISSPGCDVAVEKSSLAAVGALFGGETQATIRDLHNRKEISDMTFPAKDRTVRFVDSVVEAWNFYVEGNARVRIEKCTFGESGAEGDADLEIVDSTCDGSGGFIGAGGRAQVRLTRSKVLCLLRARGTSKVVLEDCEVTGEVSASEDAVIEIVRCRVTGPITKFGNGRVIRK